METFTGQRVEQFGRLLKAVRARVEHVIGRMKNCKILRRRHHRGNDEAGRPVG